MAIKCAQIDKVKIGAGQPLAIIAGPCVIESRDHTLKMADAIAPICRRLDVPLVFKASFDKANRTSANAYRGPGLEKAIDIFAAIGREMGLPVTTDIHLPDWQTGRGTTRILRSLGRVSTDVTIKKLGLSRRVELLDHATGTDVHIVGTTAAFSPEAAGDKAVLALLDVPA